MSGRHRSVGRFGSTVAVLLLALPWGVGAQLLPGTSDWTVRRWTTDSGLPQNSANDIAQTPDGFLWIATFGGLARFDGVEFEIFDTSNMPELGQARILGVGAGRDGSVWIGTETSGAVVRRPDGGVERVDFEHPPGQVWDFAAPADGSVWIRTQLGTFRVPAGGGTRAELLDDGAGFRTSARIAAGEDGVWIATGAAPLELLRYPADASEPDLRLPLTAPPLEIAVIDGVVHLALGSTLQRWSPGPDGDWRSETLPLPATTVPRWMPPPDDDGANWFGFGIPAAGDGRLLVDGPALELLGPRGLPVRAFQVSFVDREGSLWLGSRGDGLYQVRPAAVRMPEPPEVQADRREALSMVALPDSTVLVDTCPHLHLYRGTERLRDIVEPACRDQMVATADGRVFAAQGSELFELVGIDRVVESTGVTDLLRLTRDPEGRPHRIRRSGWEFWEAGEWRSWEDAPELDPGLRAGVFILPSGVWAGTDSTIVRARPDGVTRWTRVDGVPGGTKRWFHEDSRGVVWVATYGGGLVRIGNGRLDVIDRSRGLPESFLSAILQHGGELYLHGNQALTRARIDELDSAALGKDRRRLRPAEFRSSDGFHESSGAVAAVDAAGRLWFGSIDGAVFHDPEAGPGVPPPLPVIRAILADDVVLAPGEPVPAGTRRLAISFTSPTFVNADRVRFEFRLRGFGEEWTDAGTQRSVVITDPDPGSYTFEVVAFNSRGVRSVQAGSREFEVRPFFWQTWWFRIVAGILLVGAVWWIARAFNSIERRRNVELRREISERRRLEQERQELSRQLFRSQKLEAVGRLTGGIAHDFNNLLLVVTASLEIAKDETDDPVVREAVDSAMSAAFRGGALTQQLLAFSRRGMMQTTAVEIGRVLESMDQLLARSLGERIEVRVEVEDDLWPCVSDPGGLENAILNLAINARDAMEGEGRIRIGVRNVEVERPPGAKAGAAVAGPYVRIEVEDEGVGIPAEDLDRVVDPFFTTKEVGKGTGLGLSMVHGFAGQCGGFLDIRSTPGRGTTVAILLPRALHAAAPAAEEGSWVTETPQGSGETILLLEDNDQVRLLTALLLEDLGYLVIETEAPEAAERWIRRQGLPDLLLTDIVLPGESGIEFAGRIRVEHPDLLVLAMTGFAPEGLREDMRGYPILEKPFTRADLGRAVADALRARAPTGG